MNLHKITLSHRLHATALEKINKFVEAMKQKGQSGDYYAKQRAASTPYDDIALGKMGEFFAAVFLRNHQDYPVCLPDLQVYQSNQKNYAADLTYPEPFLNTHVKTCNGKTLRFAGQKSWTFQASDSLFYQDESQEQIALVFLNNINSISGEVAVFSWQELKTKFRPPLSPKFIGSKLCLYENDLFPMLEHKNAG